MLEAIVVLFRTSENIFNVYEFFADVQIVGYDHISRMSLGCPSDLRKWPKRLRHVSDVGASERRPLDIVCYVGNYLVFNVPEPSGARLNER